MIHHFQVMVCFEFKEEKHVELITCETDFFCMNKINPRLIKIGHICTALLIYVLSYFFICKIEISMNTTKDPLSTDNKS